MPDWHISVDDALAKLPGPNGESAADLFKHGTVTIRLVAPRGEDLQAPHAQHEVYVVIRGTGRFRRGEEATEVRTSDTIFLPAGEAHRFENLTEDFAAWVVSCRSVDDKPTSPSFSADIRPLFREQDINAMKSFGNFDLSSYADVRSKATEILERLKDGSMPCDGPWPEQQVQLFHNWMAQGMNP